MEQQNEDFDQKRFIVAMVISGVVLLIWQNFFAPDYPEPEAPTEDVAQTAEKSKTKADQKTDPSKTNAEPAIDLKSDTDFAKHPKLEHMLELNGAELTVSSIGAQLKAATIDDPEQYKAAGNIMGDFPDETKMSFELGFANETIVAPGNIPWEFVAADSTPDGNGNYTKLTYRFSDSQGRYTVDKTYAALDSKYGMTATIRVKNKMANGRIADQMQITMRGYNDPDLSLGFLDFRPDEWEGICKTSDDLERNLFASLKDEEPFKSEATSFLWTAVNKRYTLISAMPETPSTKCEMRVDGDVFETIVTHSDFDAPSNGEVATTFTMFVGPKDFDVLSEAGAGLSESVDYGILTFICRPMRWALIQAYSVTHNWGLAIILLTLIIRLALWPINKKVYSNSEKMKVLQPQLAEIKTKYKNDQQRMSEESMKLMKENGASMFGCAPMLLQFPVLLAMYFTILYSAELYQATFAFWYTDLSAPDPYYILPVAMGAVMFLQSRMMPTAEGPNMAQMKMMMRIMPVMMSVFMIFLPSGAVLYYFVSSLIGIVQQYLIRRSFAERAEA